MEEILTMRAGTGSHAGMTRAVPSNVLQRLFAAVLGVALTCFVLAHPVISGWNGKRYTLAAWIGGGAGDWNWGNVAGMVLLLILVFAWDIRRSASALAGLRGNAAWLVGFAAAFLLFLAAIKAQWYSPSAVAIPLMVACGIGWISGVAGLRRFWVPVLLLPVAIPPAFLLHYHLKARSVAQVWMGTDHWSVAGDGILQRRFGPDVLREWATAIRFLEDSLPMPAHTLLVTSLMCWLIPGRAWLKMILMLGGFCIMFLEMALNTGC